MNLLKNIQSGEFIEFDDLIEPLIQYCLIIKNDLSDICNFTNPYYTSPMANPDRLNSSLLEAICVMINYNIEGIKTNYMNVITDDMKKTQLKMDIDLLYVKYREFYTNICHIDFYI